MHNGMASLKKKIIYIHKIMQYTEDITQIN